MGSVLSVLYYLAGSLATLITAHLCSQILFCRKNEPPIVFHWVPFIGNAIAYGMSPYKFLTTCREKHGDIFTFILFGRRITVYLGLTGNDFILNGRHTHLNAEEIYSPLTTPVFGSDVVYDCPNSKLIEQKKFIKYGLTQTALESHVPLIEKEVLDYIKEAKEWKGQKGEVEICSAMAEITIFTAGRALQGAEVRKKLTREFADLYHDLDMGFRPINFLAPWAPLPQNRRRDAAHAKMRAIYEDIIQKRRQFGKEKAAEENDMIANLMDSVYKNGKPVPDKEIAHIMITLLMAGQHSSSSASSWIMLRLASQPEIVEELYQEQVECLSQHGELPPLRYADLDKLSLLQGVVKETLRVHSSITSIMRKVTKPMNIPGTEYVVGTDKVMLASPVVTALSDEYFGNAATWDPHRWDSHAEVDEDDIVDYGYGATSKGTKNPYLPFGAGRHRCIGEKFAYVNLGVIISTMVRHYKFSTIDGSRSVPETDYTSLFARPQQPARIRWERRTL